MVNAIRIALMLFGLAVALLGIGVDILLPGASPGLNLPQLLLILAGFGISVFAYYLRRPRFRRRLKAVSRRDMVAAVLVTVITILALELLLTIFGMSVYFEGVPGTADYDAVRTRFCDNAGCRWIYEAVREECARGELSGRYCIVNRQGFADDEDFVAAADLAGRKRILALGDSFTHGFSAEAGKSFLSRPSKRAIPRSSFGMRDFLGAGTNQAVASFESLAPILQPELTILGFYWQ